MERITHNGNIMTDDLVSPGYVFYRCSAYNLPDNTMGNVGYHVCYRPLCGDMYVGNDLVTTEMIQHTKEHYAEVKKIEEIERKAKFAAMIAEISKPVVLSPMDKMICKHCGTVCYGDCRA